MVLLLCIASRSLSAIRAASLASRQRCIEQGAMHPLSHESPQARASASYRNHDFCASEVFVDCGCLLAVSSPRPTRHLNSNAVKYPDVVELSRYTLRPFCRLRASQCPSGLVFRDILAMRVSQSPAHPSTRRLTPSSPVKLSSLQLSSF